MCIWILIRTDPQYGRHPGSGSPVWETSWIRICSLGDLLDPDPHGSVLWETSWIGIRIRMEDADSDLDPVGKKSKIKPVLKVVLEEEK